MAPKIFIDSHHPLTMNSGMPSCSMPNTCPPGLVKKAELAKRLSVCDRQIDEWVKQKMIPYIKPGPHCIRYDVAEVIAELKKRYQVNPRDRE